MVGTSVPPGNPQEAHSVEFCGRPALRLQAVARGVRTRARGADHCTRDNDSGAVLEEPG
jgi:hypothetical protein